MKLKHFYKIVREQLEILADKKAGYPPNCNEGYVEKDGKCVPIDESDAYWSKKDKKKKKKD